MEIVDIHSFATMDLDSENRVILATNARQIRNMRLNEFGKSGVLVSMRGTKKIHGVRIEPPIVHTVGSINVGIGIQDRPEDSTYFRIILTGRSAARPVFSEYTNQQQSVTFADIPLDTYDVTQELPVNYANISITPNPVVISESNRYANVWVFNNIPPVLRLTFDGSIFPVADINAVGDWSSFLSLPPNGTPFTSVGVNGNIISLHGGNIIDMSLVDNGTLIDIANLNSFKDIRSASFQFCLELENPPDLSGLILLESLSFTDSSVLSSPPDLIGLNSLRQLLMSACHALVYPPPLSGLTALEDIYLTDCSFLTPPNLTGLTSLKSFVMYYCPNIDLTGVDQVLTYFLDLYPNCTYVDIRNGVSPTPATLAAAQAANPQCTFVTS